MRSLIKMILLATPFTQNFLNRATSWLNREKYSRVDNAMFQSLINNLKINQTHGALLKRFGSEFDGGYILADLQKRYDKLISFGVGDNIDFEVSLAGVVEEIELFDHTVENLPVFLENAKFHKMGLSNLKSSQFVNLEQVTPPGTNNLILKIDIEGDEWESLLDVKSDCLNAYAQIVLEIHDLHKIDDPKLLKVYIQVLQSLHLAHELIFVHGNNWSQVKLVRGYLFPDVLEVTFLRRDLVPLGKQDSSFLESLHAPNNPMNEDLKLSF